MIFQNPASTPTKLPTTRIQQRPHQHNVTSNIWRQWERLTVSGIRVNNKRYNFVQTFFVWFLALAALYLLRLIAKRRKDDNKLPDDDPAGFWKDRHLIFCMSSGRSGSKHLYNVLEAGNNIRSFHEPNPSMTGSILQNVLFKGKRSDTFDERANLKLDAIQRELRGTKPIVTYAETSHMFIKTFSDIILHRLGDVANITIISLHRPLSDVIYSQLTLGWFSKRHSGNGVWYYDINDLHQGERILSVNVNKFNTTSLASPIEKLIGYNADILQRQKLLREQVGKMQKEGRWNSVRIIDVNVGDLSGSEAITRFLSKAGITPDKRRLQLLSAQDDNQRELKKDRVHVSSTRRDVNQRLNELSGKISILQHAVGH